MKKVTVLIKDEGVGTTWIESDKVRMRQFYMSEPKGGWLKTEVNKSPITLLTVNMPDHLREHLENIVEDYCKR